MREPRNPFRMRTSQRIESEETFLRLFSPGVLEILPEENLWDGVQTFLSSPGGGKTSLFRAFTPAALLTLHELRAANEDYKELSSWMKSLEVLSENGGPQILGILLPCARNYATLEDLSFEKSRKERLFFSLLNARLVLAALRGALALKKLNYPDDLERLRILPPPHDDPPARLTLPASGREVFEWARSIERGVCEAIDSFGPISQAKLEGHDTLHAVALLRPECITCDGEPVGRRTLVMFDDVHKLTEHQQQKLKDALSDLRPSISVWIAERLEALSPNELFAQGATTGREYEQQIHLEQFWRTGSPKKFEKTLINIADRRAKSARDFPYGSFAGCLQDSLDGVEWQDHFNKAIEVVSNRIRNMASNTRRYDDWMRAKEKFEGTPRERAVAWRMLEIIIERERMREQMSFNFALPVEQLKDMEDSTVRSAAELFIAQEFKLPYYFGISRLSALASSNIEQFLALSGDLFEEIISAEVLKRRDGPSQVSLSPKRQESILEKAVRQRWEEIPRRIPNGRDVQRLLEALHQCTLWEWNKRRASYGAGGGVTGIAITMSDRHRILSSRVQIEHPEYKRLVNTLSVCISHNLLEASLDRSQGKKGKTWMILYLNRWLCVQFGLPLQYGGWRPKTPDELCLWLERGFRPPKENERVLT